MEAYLTVNKTYLHQYEIIGIDEIHNLYKEKMHDLESKLTEAFDDLFKRMIEDNFSNATILNNPKDFSLFIFDEKNPNAGPKKMSLQQVRQFIDNGFK